MATPRRKGHASGALIRARHHVRLPGLNSFAPLIRAVKAADIVCRAAPPPVTMPGQVHSAEQFAALHGQPDEAALIKAAAMLTAAQRALLEASPFVVLATTGTGGLNASPRGDPAPVLVVQDERTLLLPDRRGNRRLDSLCNIVADPRVALLGLAPGTSETLHINGRGGAAAPTIGS